MKCLSCDNDNDYYKKSDESGYNFNCYHGDVDYYYLDSYNKLYKPCFDSCKTCNSEVVKELHRVIIVLIVELIIIILSMIILNAGI